MHCNPSKAFTARIKGGHQATAVRGWASGIIMAAVLFIFVALAAAGNRGPDKIEIFGGNLGMIPFPHADHQNRIKDCKVCHSLFPEHADSIKTMTEKGALAPKKVMNTLCIKCHRQAKMDGKPHGPLTCKKCHIK